MYFYDRYVQILNKCHLIPEQHITQKKGSEPYRTKW